MNITIPFVLGLLIAFIGVVPPGLLNMTAAKISLKEGHNRGLIFSIGACVIVILQTWIATICASYLSNHPDVVDILKRVALVIFILITIYFFVLAQRQPKQKKEIEVTIKSKKSRFFQGILLSILNMFPIPYQAYMTINVVSFGWMTFDKLSVYSYIAGAAMGTFIVFYIYMFFFNKIKADKLTNQKSMNYLVGAVTGIIAIITLINLLREA